MDNEVSDVNTVEQTTDSSSEFEQSTQEDTSTPAGEQSNTQVSESEEDYSEGEGEDHRIPYEKFQRKVHELNSMKEQMAELEAKAEIADRLSQAVNPQVTSPEQQARQRQLDAAKKELESMGYVDETKVDQLVEQKLNAYKWQERFVQQMDSLAKKYTGKDGGPKFEAEEVAKFMDEQMQRGNQITDPEMAFKLMNLDQIADSKAKAQKSSTYSESPGKPIHSETDQRKADLEAAAKTGKISEFLKKYAAPSE